MSSHSGRAEEARRPQGQPVGRLTRDPELTAIRRGLLEVIAEDPAVLGTRADPRLEPVGEALVEVGALGLRQAGVRRVADEQMAEAECLDRRRRSSRLGRRDLVG